MSGGRCERGARCFFGPLTLAFGNQARSRTFDLALQPLEEQILVEAGLDRVEHLHPDRPRIAPERTAWPEQAGVERDREAWNAHPGIQVRDAVLVFRFGAGSPARALRKDHDLTIARKLLAHTRVHVGEPLRALAAIHRDHPRLPGVPAEERNPHQLA